MLLLASVSQTNSSAKEQIQETDKTTFRNAKKKMREELTKVYDYTYMLLKRAKVL